MAKRRNRPNPDIDPKISSLIKALSIEYGVPASQLYNLFLALGLLGHMNNKADIRERLRRSDSPAFLHNIDIDDILDRLPDEE